MQGSLNNQFIWCWKFQLCLLTLSWGHCNLTGWLLHVLDSSPVHIQHVLYYRWAMMMRLNVLLLNLLNLWKSKHFFAVTVSWKSQWDLQITITYEIIVPWWASMLRNVGTIPQIVLQYYLKMMNHSLLRMMICNMDCLTSFVLQVLNMLFIYLVTGVSIPLLH